MNRRQVAALIDHHQPRHDRRQRRRARRRLARFLAAAEKPPRITYSHEPETRR